MIKSLANGTDGHSFKELGLLSLEKQRRIPTLKYIRGCYTKVGGQLFSISQKKGKKKSEDDEVVLNSSGRD